VAGRGRKVCAPAARPCASLIERLTPKARVVTMGRAGAPCRRRPHLELDAARPHHEALNYRDEEGRAPGPTRASGRARRRPRTPRGG
jgi:hypothetical protein